MEFKPSKMNYRSFKDFDLKQFNHDLSLVPFHVPHIFDDINDVYWAHEMLLNQVVNDHIPMKEKYKRKASAPFMNGEFRRAINYRKSLYRKYDKCKTDHNWNNFRKQRNKCTKLKRQAIRLYFAERCGGGVKSNDFWPTIRPFLSNKGGGGCEQIHLRENNDTISEPEHVSGIFNSFFVNVAKDIGNPQDLSNSLTNHPSIQNIRKNMPQAKILSTFKKIEVKDTRKYWSKEGYGCRQHIN